MEKEFKNVVSVSINTLV